MLIDKVHRNCTLYVVIVFVLTLMTVAQSQEKEDKLPEQWKEGETEYKAGCLLANSVGVQACAELPSGQEARKEKESADANASLLSINQLLDDSQGVSASCAHVSPDAPVAVTSACQNLRQGASDVAAATPDFSTLAIAQGQSGSTDVKVPAYTTWQRVVAWGVEGIPSTETQNTPGRTPNFETSEADRKAAANQMNQYGNAQQAYQNAAQNFFDVVSAIARQNVPANGYAPLNQSASIQAGLNSAGQTRGSSYAPITVWRPAPTPVPMSQPAGGSTDCPPGAHACK